jgi:recombination protein RecT
MTAPADTKAITEALERRKAEPKQKTLADLIERQAPAIEQLLRPVGMDVERFKRILHVEIRRNPALLQCDPLSVLGAGMLCAQVALTPGPLGHVYLVPFKRKGEGYECTFILGYTGMIALARRSGELAGIRAATVREGDVFEYEEREGKPYLRHRVTEPPGDRKVLGYYGHATLRGGTPLVKYLWPEEADAGRIRSPLGRQLKGPWATDYEAMAWKTCVRRMRAWLPLTADFSEAAAYDETVVSYDEHEEALEPPASDDGLGQA